jgi:uncharacterized protein (DUF1501 family)
MGAGVKSGIFGKQPSLVDLDERGNLKMQVDFRTVYATILERFLKVPNDTVLGQKFPLLEFIA